MSEQRYIRGSLGSNRESMIVARAAEALEKGKRVDFLLPSVNHIQTYRRALLKGVTFTLPGQLFLGTFVAWANRILDQAGVTVAIISRQEEWIRIQTLARRTAGQPGSPGCITLLQEIFDNFRNTGLDANALRQLFRRQKFGRALAYLDLFEELERQYAQKRIGTTTHSLALALQTLQDDPPDFEGDCLFVDGFYEMVPLQTTLLRHISQYYRQTIIGIIDHPDHPVYSYCKDLWPELGQDNSESAIENSDQNDALGRIRQQLFRVPPVDTEALHFDRSWKNLRQMQGLAVLRCPTRRAEVETVAAVLRKWLREGGAVERVAVVYRGGYDYSRLIQTIFPQYGIPVSKPELALADMEPAQLLLRILALNAVDFRREDLEDLFRHRIVRERYGEEALLEFEYLSKAWGSPYGQQNWLKQLNQRRDFLHSLSGVEAEEYGFFPADIDEQIQKIEMILPAITRLFTDVRVPQEAAVAEYEEVCYGLLHRFYGELSGDSLIRTIEKIRLLLRKISQMIAVDEKIPLTLFVQYLKKMMQTETIRDGAQQTSGILVTDLMSARGRDFDVLILLGMVDGEFPALRKENPLFDNRRRREFNSLAEERLFADTGSNPAEERFLLYYLLAQARQNVLITFPEMNNAGKQLAVSGLLAFLFSACREAGALERGDASFETLAVQEKSEAIKTLEEGKALALGGEWAGSDRELFGDILGEAALENMRHRRRAERSRREELSGNWNGNLADSGPFPSLVSKKFSATKIQDYAWCPFLYLCRHLWKVYTSEEPSIDLTPLAEGLLIHITFEKFVAPFVQSGSDDWKGYLEANVEEKIEVCITEIDRQYRPRYNFLSDGVWTRKLADLRQGLQAFAKTELDYIELDFRPFQLERQFEYADREFAITLDGEELPIQFRGKIDRIDISSIDQAAFIIEYKRTENTAHNVPKGVADGIHFQIPMYLMTLERERKTAGFVSHAFFGGKRVKGFSLHGKSAGIKTMREDELRQLLDDAKTKLLEKFSGIAMGHFNLHPFNTTRCKRNGCSFYDLCRIDPGKIAFSEADTESETILQE